MGVIQPYSIGKRNLSCNNHWEEIDINKHRITKPTVLCFPGNGCLNAEDANHFSKVAQSLVNLKEPTRPNQFATSKDIDFIGISYGANSESTRLGSLTDDEKDEIVNNLFVPLFKNDNGEVLSQNEILRNFNKITFFSHCHGASEINEIIHRTYNEMINAGISEENANDSIGELFSVSFAPWQKVQCPNLQVVSKRDPVLKGAPKGSEIMSRLLSDKYKNSIRETVAYKEDDYTISVVCDSLIYNGIITEHDVDILYRDDEWNLITAFSNCADEVSQAMGCAMAMSAGNSIRNEENQKNDSNSQLILKPSIDTFLYATETFLGNKQNSEYLNIINYIKMENEFFAIEGDSLTEERL